MKRNNNSKNINGTLIKESLLDYNNLATQIKENTPDLVKSLLGEQVRQAYASLLNESDDDDVEDKDYDVEEVDDTISEPDETEETEEVADDTVDDTEEDAESGMEPDSTDETEDAPEGEEETEEEPVVDDVDGDDEISQSFDKFKTPDGEYDFRNAQDDELVKVYKLLKADDNVTVVKDDGKVQISDNETGAEYIIDFGNDTETSNKLDDNINTDDMNESRIYEIALNEYDSHVGYTDNYQKKDVMTNDGVSEPSKNGRDIDKGVPQNTQKPWSKQKKNVAPFNKTTNECGNMDNAPEIEEDVTKYGAHSTGTSISHKPQTNSPRGARNMETADGRKTGTADNPYGAKMESIEKKAAKIFEENKKLKNMLNKFQSQLMEAAVTNVNLGGIIKLISENSTSKEEKKEIINRFTNEAHTITESQNLYARISEELKRKPAVKADINEEKQYGNTQTEVINESKFYQDDSLIDSLGLMHKICK